MTSPGSAPPEMQQSPGRRPLAWAIPAFLFLTLSAMGLWLAAHVTGAQRLTLDPRLLDPAALASITALLIVYYLSDGLRLYYVLRALDVPVRLRKLLPLVFINILFSNITPLASGGGFAQVWYLKGQGVSVGTSAAATTIRTILAMAAIFLSAPALQFLHPTQAINGGLGRAMSQSLSVLMLVLLAGFIILLARPTWLQRASNGLLRALRSIRLISTARQMRWSDALGRETTAFAQGFHQFLKAPCRHSLGAILWTLIFLLVLFSFPGLLMVLLDYQIDWLSVIGSLAVVTFLMYFAPTPGGAGFAELAFAGLMATQITGSDLVLVIFVWRCLTTYLGMALGLVVSALLLARSGRAP